MSVQTKNETPANGPNRAGRRKNAGFERALKGINHNNAVESERFRQKNERQAKVERRINRARVRRMEREEARKKGLPVKYSIK